MKYTPELTKGELYHLMTHLVIPAEKRNLELVITRAKIEELIRLEKENRRL